MSRVVTLRTTAYSFRIPLRFLRGSYTRLALTVIALASGVALVCAIDLVNRAVLRGFVEVIDTMAGRAALQVRAGEGGLFPESVAATVSAVPGVELAVPLVSASAFTAEDTGELLTIHGVDIANDRAVRVYDARDQGGLVLDDPLVFLSQPDSIVLTRAFAERRGLAVDDQLSLVTPTGQRRFTIRALLEPQGVARVYGGNLAVMDLYAAEKAFTRPEYINRVDVVVERGDEIARVADAIAAVLPAGLRVEAPFPRSVWQSGSRSGSGWRARSSPSSPPPWRWPTSRWRPTQRSWLAPARWLSRPPSAWEPRCWRRRFRPAAWPRLAWRRRSAAAAWSSRG